MVAYCDRYSLSLTSDQALPAPDQEPGYRKLRMILLLILL